jgi:tetratricopeptide (TPR) repeat protein
MDSIFDSSYGDKAMILDMLGKYNESIILYCKALEFKALELNPKNPITWYNKGLTFLHLKELDKAIKCLIMLFLMIKPILKHNIMKANILK